MHKTGTLIAALLTLSLLTALTTEFAGLTRANFLTPDIVPVEHAYIRSNGEVDPPTAPIQRTGNHYTLTDDLLNCSIQIDKDNVMLDGNSFSISLPSKIDTSGHGLSAAKTGDALIRIANRTNVVIKNVTSDNYFVGIAIENSSNVILVGNNFRCGRLSLYLSLISNCTIIGNKMTENANLGIRIINGEGLKIEYNRLNAMA